MLTNGSGGIDWSGLSLAVEMYGVRDLQGLVGRLLAIKAHKPPEEKKEAR